MKNTPSFIRVLDNALSAEDCQTLIDTFETFTKAGTTFNRQESEPGVRKEIKNDTSTSLIQSCLLQNASAKEANELISAVSKAAAAYVEEFQTGFFGKVGSFAEKGIGPYPLQHEGARMQKTNPSEGYHIWHHERSNFNQGHRALSWLFYLNDVDVGGETEFIHYSKRIKAKQGRLVMFPAGFTHTHRGNPPLSNSKYLVAGWIRYL